MKEKNKKTCLNCIHANAWKECGSWFVECKKRIYEKFTTEEKDAYQESDGGEFAEKCRFFVKGK